MMSRNSILAGCLLFAGSVLSQGRLSDECTDFRLNSGWLVGKCLTGAGDKTLESAVYLDGKVRNDQGTLKVCTAVQWKDTVS